MTGHADFLATLGDEFLLGDGTRLQLREVSELTEQGDYLSYSLRFTGSPDHLVGQGMQDLAHETLGSQSLFLVPLGPGGDGFEYEAVFSYLRISRETATP